MIANVKEINNNNINITQSRVLLRKEEIRPNI